MSLSQLPWGTEWDWMNFFWAWHSVGENKVPMDTIYEIIQMACGGWCDDDDISWNDVRGAALEKWGADTPGYNNFIDWAGANGVDQ